jgi:1,4-alpha-glucan branching enzyme
VITKSYSKAGRSCRVTFKIPAGQAAVQSAVVLGDFNGWNAHATPMKRGRDGGWSATVTMATGRPYRFRYLLDGTHWANDDGADAAVRNHFGTEDSVVSLAGEAPVAQPAKKAAKAPATRSAKSVGKVAKGNGKPATKKAAEAAPAPPAAKTRTAKTTRSEAREK